MRSQHEQNRQRVSQEIRDHEEKMQQNLEEHTVHSQDRLARAVAKTSETIGRAGQFAKKHTPGAIGRHAEGLARRAQAALDDTDNKE